jgi:dihydropteroate synthase
MTSINLKGSLIELNSVKIMGILNVTPDSFSDGGNFFTLEKAFLHAAKMISEGTDIIDVGGCSSRPGANIVSEQQELDRVIPVIERLVKNFNIPISIDTFRSAVAHEAVRAGASMVNDISAGEDDNKMISLVAKLGIPYIVMHKKGTPTTMQDSPKYENVVSEVLQFFIQKKEECFKAGIKDLIFDPGFGFGKTIDHNYELLKNLEAFVILDSPILVGISRKSMIYKLLEISPKDSVNATTFLHAIALTKGAHLIRVHDVKEAVQGISLWNKLHNVMLRSTSSL